MSTKICAICNVEKDKSLYAKYSNRCKSCYNELNKKRYNENAAIESKKRNDKQKEDRKALKELKEALSEIETIKTENKLLKEEIEKIKHCEGYLKISTVMNKYDKLMAVYKKFESLDKLECDMGELDERTRSE